MGGYTQSTIRDASGQIVGYAPVTAENPYNPAGYQASATDAYNAIVTQYNQMHQNAATHAAFIQQPGYVQGGAGEFTGRAAEYQRQWQQLQPSRASQELANQPVRATVPMRDLSSNINNQISQKTVDVYVPEGRYSQQQIKDAKLGLGYNTGEIAIYEQPRGHAIFNLIGGGGRAAAQSGMFSINEPMTPNVIARGQVQNYAKPSGEGMSRLGAEAYGGIVQPLDGRVLDASAKMSVYKNPNNIANFVNPEGANLGKAVAPGADIPWSAGREAPAIQYMDQKGFIPGSGVDIPGRSNIVQNIQPTPPQANPTYNGITFTSIEKMGSVASPVVTPTVIGSGNPLEIVNNAFPRATAANAGVNINPDYSTPVSVESGVNYGIIPAPVSGLPQQQTREQQIIELLRQPYSGGIVGKVAFGEKAPEVIKGFVGSVSDVGTGLVGWTPFKDKMQVVDPSLQQFRVEKAALETATPEIYNKFLQENVAKGNLFSQPGSGTLIENPKLTYDYGEYTKWGVGAGDVVKGKLNITDAQLNQYQFQLEQKKGIEYIPEKLVFGTGATLATNPERIATAYGAGAVMILGGEVIGGAYAATTLPARAAAFAVSHPTASTVIGGAVRYGIPAALLGATYYGASEGLTATPERTTVNIGRMIPEAGGLIYGGASAKLGIRVIDAGYIGYGTKPVKKIDVSDVKVIDLTGKEPTRLPVPARQYTSGVQSSPKPTAFEPKKTVFTVDASTLTNVREYVSGGQSRTPVQRTPSVASPTMPVKIETVIPTPNPIGYKLSSPAPKAGPSGATMRMEPLKLDVRNVINLENVKPELIITDHYATGGIKSMVPFKGRNFKLGDPFKAGRRTAGVSPERPGSKYSGVSESTIRLGETPAEIQQPATLSKQIAQQTQVSSLGQNRIVSQTQQSLSKQSQSQFVVNVAKQRQTPVQAASPLQITQPASIQAISPVTTQNYTQPPAASNIPPLTQITPTIYPKSATPADTYLPAYTPLPRYVPERAPTPDTPFIPTPTPTIRPVPEKVFDPWVEPVGPKPPVDPTPDIPIPPPLRLWGFPPGSGGGAGSRTRKRRKVELFSFEMGQDSPIPTRFGLGGTTTEYIPGVRGIAIDILSPRDVAPNRLFDLNRNQRDRL